jgi:hypothetical protein
MIPGCFVAKFCWSNSVEVRHESIAGQEMVSKKMNPYFGGIFHPFPF